MFEFNNDVDRLDKQIADLIIRNFIPESDEVQKLIKRHYELKENFFDLKREAYLSLIRMYEENESTIKTFFEAYHPEMQKIMCAAMRYSAGKNL